MRLFKYTLNSYKFACGTKWNILSVRHPLLPRLSCNQTPKWKLWPCEQHAFDSNDRVSVISVCYQSCCCAAVRAEGQAEAHLRALTSSPSSVSSAAAVCSAAEGILLVFSGGAGKLNSRVSWKPLPCPQHRYTAHRCFILWTDVLSGVGTLGAIQRRFKGLCFFMTWPQLPQVLYGNKPCYGYGSTLPENQSCFLYSFFLFGFGCVFGHTATQRMITGNIVCVSTARLRNER